MLKIYSVNNHDIFTILTWLNRNGSKEFDDDDGGGKRRKRIALSRWQKQKLLTSLLLLAKSLLFFFLFFSLALKFIAIIRRIRCINIDFCCLFKIHCLFSGQTSALRRNLPLFDVVHFVAIAVIIIIKMNVHVHQWLCLQDKKQRDEQQHLSNIHYWSKLNQIKGNAVEGHKFTKNRTTKHRKRVNEKRVLILNFPCFCVCVCANIYGKRLNTIKYKWDRLKEPPLPPLPPPSL